MAVAYKNIVITPNIGNTAEPKITFSGANSSANTDVQLRVLPDDGGIVQFEKSDNTALLSISSNNKLTIANNTKLIANGSAGGSGDVLASNSTGVYWKTMSDLNTTYSVNAVSGSGYANVRLYGSDSTTDDIKFVGSGSVAVSFTDANTITISGTDNNTTYTVNSASNTTSGNVILQPSSGSNTQIKFVGSGATTVSSDGTTITVSSTDNNTTYDLAALSTTGGANVRLSDSSNSNDDIKFTGSGSVTVSVSGNTITISGTDTDTNTTYSVEAVSGTGYANVRLSDSSLSNDDIKFQGTGGIVVSQVDANTVNVAINAAASYTWTNAHIFNANLTANDVVINGNLTVSGTTTYVNSTQLNIGDNVISLNADLTGSPTETAGIEVNRGTSANVYMQYNETSDNWELTNNGTDYIGLKAGNSTIVANSSGIFANVSAIDTNTTYTIDSASNTTSANVILIPSSGSNTQLKFVGSGATTVSSDGDTITITSTDTNTDTNTTYDLSALATTGGANVRLSDSSNSNDDIKFTGSGSVSVTVSGNTITISGTDTDTNTTYDQLAVAGSGYANLRLHASTDANDDVKFIGSGTVTVSQTDANTITITGTGATPAGSNTQIQYNTNGSLGANAQFTLDYDTALLTVGNTASTLAPTLLIVNSTSTGSLSSLQLKVGNTTVNSTVSSTTTSLYTNATSTAFHIAANGNIGIQTTAPEYNLQVNGSFAAVSKSFLIDHPLKKGWKLRYGSLESPYHGIRLTGMGEIKNGKVKIDLPKYVKKLVRNEDSQVQLTNYQHGKILWVDSVDADKNSFTVKMDREKGDKEVYKFFWSFTAIRKDIEDMIVEFEEE